MFLWPDVCSSVGQVQQCPAADLTDLLQRRKKVLARLPSGRRRRNNWIFKIKVYFSRLLLCPVHWCIHTKYGMLGLFTLNLKYFALTYWMTSSALQLKQVVNSQQHSSATRCSPPSASSSFAIGADWLVGAAIQGWRIAVLHSPPDLLLAPNCRPRAVIAEPVWFFCVTRLSLALPLLITYVLSRTCREGSHFYSK